MPHVVTTEAQLRAVLDATIHPPWAYGPTGPRVEIAAGASIALSEPLAISGRAHCEVSGAGMFASRIVGVGGGKPVIRLEQCLHCEVSGLTIYAPATARAGIEIGNRSPGPNWPISSSNTIRDVSVDGSPRYGVSVASWVPDDDETNDRDANNEFHRFEGVEVGGATEASFHVRGGQAHRLRYSDCTATGGKYGHHFEYGAHFIIERQQYTNLETAIQLGSFWTSARLSHCRLEGCRKLWNAGEGSPMPVTMEYIDADLTPQPYESVIHHVGSGPIVLRAVRLAATNGSPFIVGLYSHFPGTVRIEGLSMVWSDPPLGDVPQRAVVIGDQLALANGSDTHYTEEIIYPDGSRTFREVPIRPADDVARGRMPLTVPRSHYTWGSECDRMPSPLPPASTEKARSFAVAFTVVFDAEYLGQHQELLSANGFQLRVLRYPDRWQWRNEAAGQIDMPAVQAGVPYRVVQSWDRDTSASWLRVNDTVVGTNPGGNWQQLEEDGVTRTGDWSWGSAVAMMNSGGVPQGGGRLGATITDACCWDRSLSAAEVAVA